MTPEALIVPALRGDDVPWPERGDDLSRAVLDAAAAHGVAPLLWKASGIAGWPDAVRDATSRADRRVGQWLEDDDTDSLAESTAGQWPRLVRLQP